MKRLLPGIVCVLSGFALARLVPLAGGRSAPPAPEPAAALSLPKNTDAGRVPAPASFSLEGDWQPAAKAWAERNPAEFYHWLVERGIPPGEEVLHVLFRNWLLQDVDAAFTAAFNLPGDFKRGDSLLAMMCSWTLAGPGGLKALLKWIPQVEEQMHGWASPGYEIILNAPPEETAALLAETATPMKYSGTLLRHFTTYWAEQDLPAARAWVKTLSPPLQAEAFSGLMQTWAETDGDAALQYLATEATSSERRNAHMPLEKLAETDPRAALQWWENNIGVADPTVMNRILVNWNEKDGREDIDYMMNIEDPTLRRHTQEAWGGAAKTEEVLEVLGQITAVQDRQALLRGLTERYNFNEPEIASVRNLVADPSNPDITPAMAASVSRRYAYDHPPAALEWAATLPEALQAESAREVIQAWKDKVAAAQAVETLPDSPAKTAAREALKPESSLDPFR